MIKGELTMGLKEKLAQKILEMKLSEASKHAKSAIQKLQQQYDKLVTESREEE
jgi:hypothetical protein